MSKERQATMDVKSLVAIDVHTHAEVSSRIADDPMSQAMREASIQYFKNEGQRPTIAEVAAYYRQRKMACVIFPVDMESASGLVRVPNEEVAEVAAENGDVMIPFASIDPAKGKMGAREARRLIEQYGVRGFKFHPSVQEFYPNDRNVYILYEVIAEAGLPSVFHTGQTGIGAGMRGGAVCVSSTRIPSTWMTSRSTFPICQSSWPTPLFPGKTKPSRYACISRRYTSTSPVGPPSTSLRNSFSTRIRF
jgi:predicted TIM-barrel fold metal-dependent hydrolase